MNFVKDHVSPLLQDPQQCCVVLELCLECIDVINVILQEVQDRVSHSL